MAYKKGDVVTVMTITGEYVGKFVKRDESSLVIADPKMLVNNETGLGFGNGIAITGKESPESVTFFNGGLVFITDASQNVLTAYNQAVAGVVTSEEPEEQGDVES